LEKNEANTAVFEVFPACEPDLYAGMKAISQKLPAIFFEYEIFAKV